MGLGIREEHTFGHVPGTVFLDDGVTQSHITQGLQHGTGKDSHIVLSPQPSEDPNDPLNWSTWKKELIIVILCFGSILNAATNGVLVNDSLFTIAEELNISLTKIALSSGYNLLASGCAGPIVCALSRRYGKRPVYLASTLLNIIGTAVGESSKSYNTLLAARIIQGFSTSAYESLVYASVGDVFFVHQRGLRIGILNVMFFAAPNLVLIICGQVSTLGWQWLFHMFQIFLDIQFILMFLFCPETTYIRDIRYETDVNRDEKLQELVIIEATHREDINHASEENRPGRPAKKTFVQELAIWNGVYSHDNILKQVTGPFLTLLNPAACYSIVTSALYNSYFVGSAIIESGIFAGAPWHFGSAQVGYLGTGPFVGGMIASIFVALSGDAVIKYMTKRNNGVYEPEFRLVFTLPAGAFCSLGLFLFGWAMENKKSAVLCSFFLGIFMNGLVIGMFTCTSYGLDAFRRESNEIFIMNMLLKNLYFYGQSWYANNWAEESGPQQIMYVYGGLCLFFSVLAIPIYVWGKHLRSWWARHNLFELLNMQSNGPVSEMG